ncbi:hypothetical protein PC123_g22451 [Phytophthora cactorum]|nr:hypothetical protein PC120_g25005 [Phytophthora cactorum]KAG4042050.1 hypothetical protein PC123_g22451 [Phytophthora cactorum]
MHFRLLECSCEACAEAGEAIAVKCSWRGKVVTCLETKIACIYEFGDQLATSETTKRKKLTLTQKGFCRELADQHLPPMRIRLALSQKFGTSLEDLSSLTTVQNLVNHYSRTYLENHDRLKELTAWIRAHAFNGSVQMTQSFAFGWNHDCNRRLVVGNCSDEKPFIVGLTTNTAS